MTDTKPATPTKEARAAARLAVHEALSAAGDWGDHKRLLITRVAAHIDAERARAERAEARVKALEEALSRADRLNREHPSHWKEPHSD